MLRLFLTALLVSGAVYGTVAQESYSDRNRDRARERRTRERERNFEPGMDMMNSDGEKELPRKKYTPKDRITSAEYKLSNDRVEQIKAIVKKRFDERQDLNDANVVNEIKTAVARIVPLKPDQDPDKRSLTDIKKSFEAKVNAKFPQSPDEIRKQAEKEAAAKYVMAKIREKVKVFYRRGRQTASYEGIFYGFGMGGKSLRLNSRYIPLFDLIPESRVKFDKKFNEQAQKEYVNELVQSYLKKRLAYSEKLFNEAYAKIRKHNEKLGYIYLRNSWEPAEIIVNAYIEEMKEEAKLRAEREAIEKERLEKERRERGGDMKNPDMQQNPDGENMDDGENMEDDGGDF